MKENNSSQNSLELTKDIIISVDLIRDAIKLFVSIGSCPNS